MKGKNELYIMIIGVILLIVAVASISFAYIGKATSTGQTSINTTITDPSGGITFTYPSAVGWDLDITLDDLSIGNSSNDYSSYISSEADVTIQMTTDPDLFPNGATCNYEIVYTPTSIYTTSVGAAAAGLKDADITILCNGSLCGGFYQTDIGAITSPVTFTSSNFIPGNNYIPMKTSASSHTRSVTFNFILKFYNLNVDQSSAVGQKIAGKISIVPKGCVGNV